MTKEYPGQQNCHKNHNTQKASHKRFIGGWDHERLPLSGDKSVGKRAGCSGADFMELGVGSMVWSTWEGKIATVAMWKCITLAFSNEDD